MFLKLKLVFANLKKSDLCLRKFHFIFRRISGRSGVRLFSQNLNCEFVLLSMLCFLIAKLDSDSRTSEHFFTKQSALNVQSKAF